MMRKTLVKINFLIDQSILNFNERVDKTYIDQNQNGVKSLSSDTLPPRVLLGRKIHIISLFLHNRYPNYATDPNPFVPEVIENFKREYPDRHVRDEALNRLLKEYNSMEY